MQITRLRKERLKHDWTLEYVAMRVGTTKQTIQRIETLNRNPSYAILVKLQKLFDLHCCDLLALVDSDEDTFSSTN